MIVLEALQSINIPVKDLKSALDFYTEFLNFEIIQEMEKEKEIEGSVLLNFDNIQISLFQSESLYSTQMPFLSFILDVDDFTDAIQEIEKKNIFIINGPTISAEGESIHIVDPSGNVIELYYRDEE